MPTFAINRRSIAVEWTCRDEDDLRDRILLVSR